MNRVFKLLKENYVILQMKSNDIKDLKKKIRQLANLKEEGPYSPKDKTYTEVLEKIDTSGVRLIPTKGSRKYSNK